MKMWEAVKILRGVKVPEKDGKGNVYVIGRYIMLLDAMKTAGGVK